MKGLTRLLEGKLKLKVNREKSAVARPWERKFLGFSFTNGTMPKRRIAPKAVLRFQARIRVLTRRTRGISIEKMVRDVSRYLHPVLDELSRPLVAHVIEEATDVRIEYPVHFLSLQSDHERIERLMRTAARAEPVGEALEVGLINLIEDRHHGLLNDFVFQCRDAQRALPPIGLRWIPTPRILHPYPHARFNATHPS
jgi:hypothetical protein